MKKYLGKKNHRENLVTYAMVIAFYVVIQLLQGGGLVSPSLQGQLVPVCAYVTMAIEGYR